MQQNKQRMAMAMILAAAACWGSIGLFLHQLTLSGLSSMQAMSVRMSFAALAPAVAMRRYRRALL